MAVARRFSFSERVEAWFFQRYFDHYARMGVDEASAAGAAFARRIGPLTPTHRVALNNMRLAFPEAPAAQIDAWLAAMWEHLGRLAGEFPHLGSFEPFSDDGRIVVENAERLFAIGDGGGPVVFISGHFSNWELMPATIVRSGAPCRMTYRAANNPFIDDVIQATRRAYGATYQSAKGTEGGMGLLRALKAGQSVALMNDQKYNAGLAAPLFGHDAMTADAPTRLALRFGVDLQPMSVVRTQGARFRVIVHDPIAFDRTLPTEDAVRDGVLAVNRFIEAQVRAHPEQWFWVHRRWPKEAWAAAGIV